MSTYYPMIYDFLVEQARTHAHQSACHTPRSAASQPHVTHSLTVRTAGPLEGGGRIEDRVQDRRQDPAFGREPGGGAQAERREEGARG